jgi:hypothetical protein
MRRKIKTADAIGDCGFFALAMGRNSLVPPALWDGTIVGNTMRSIILWLIGIPLPIIIILWLILGHA